MISSTIRKAQGALRANFRGDLDAKGYTRLPQENLLPGVRMEQFEDDLKQGDGNELRVKFCAVHSSAALAVNCFAPFKDSPAKLSLLGRRGATSLRFERQLKIIPERNPANLDVWIERPGETIAVESKMLEYLKPKNAEFAEAYGQLAPPVSEASWWALYDDAKRGAAQHLDRAQLIKHYFGLRKFQSERQTSNVKLTLLYLFWEPLNWNEFEECRRHRAEVEAFSGAVSPSAISFVWTTYGNLWDEWAADPSLAAHVQNLKARYEVRL